MALSLYSIGTADIPAAQAMGFNMVGPYYGGGYQPAQAAAALEHGLKYAYQFELPAIDFVNEITTTLDAAYVTNQIRSQMEAVYDELEFESSVAWWSVDPEELRPWRSLEMEYLALFVQTIRDVEREHGRVPRPVWMYEPNHRRVDDLLVTGAHTDLIARGAYMNTRTFSRAWVAWASGTSVQASAALPHRPTPIAVLEMSADPLNVEDMNAETIRTWCRHDAYLSLLAGSKGIILWSGFRRGGFNAFDHYFQGYGTVATDLTGPLGLERVFLFGETRNDIAATVESGPTTVSFDALNSGPQTRPSLSLANLALGTNRYLLAVNSAVEPITVHFEGFPDQPVVAERLFDGHISIVWNGSFWHELKPLDAQIWRFSESLSIPTLAWNFDPTEGWSSHEVAALKEAGWSVNPVADSDTSFYVNQGGLELWDHSASGTPVVQWPLAGKSVGRITLGAGTLGQQNQQVRFSLLAGLTPLASIELYNNNRGEFTTGSGITPFSDEASWFQEVRPFTMTWRMTGEGFGGLIDLSFTAEDGTVTSLSGQPFMAQGIPDRLEWTCSFGSGINKGGRLDYFSVQHNTPPFLRPLSDQAFDAGQSLTHVISALDLDAPAQSLRYSFAQQPSGASLNPFTGLLRWRAPVSLTPSAYLFSIAVIDTGIPSLSDTQSFHINVAPAVIPHIQSIDVNESEVNLIVTGALGPDYTLEGTTNLHDWNFIRTERPENLPIMLRDARTPSAPQQYYRVTLGP